MEENRGQQLTGNGGGPPPPGAFPGFPGFPGGMPPMMMPGLTITGAMPPGAYVGGPPGVGLPPPQAPPAKGGGRRGGGGAAAAAAAAAAAGKAGGSTGSGGGGGGGAPVRYKKAPDAPKRFKSAFIIFSAEKHKEIKEAYAKEGRTEKTTDIAKVVSEAWRELPAEEKEDWEKKARKDKARYEVEKAMYKGPWKVAANKRTPKDPSAPKRPMSAFLAFSNKRRAGLKRANPNATNADLSKMLSKQWKEAPDELRRKYMDEEADLRAHYKHEMAKWRKKVAEEKKAERKEREAMAMEAAEARSNMPPGSAGEPNGMGGSASNPGMDNSSHGSTGGGGGNVGQMNQDGSNQGNMGQPGAPGQGGMYGNPYGGPGGDMSSQQGMPPGLNPALMGGNPFMQFQLSQLLAGQQFMQNPRGALGFYGQGGQQMNQGMNGNPNMVGFGSMHDGSGNQHHVQQGGYGGQQQQGGGYPQVKQEGDDGMINYGMNQYNNDGNNNNSHQV